MQAKRRLPQKKEVQTCYNTEGYEKSQLGTSLHEHIQNEVIQKQCGGKDMMAE